jgi:hypothetical protein
MREKISVAAIAAAALLLPVASFAQTSPGSAIQGSRAESPRCDSMRGTAKDQCVREETARTQNGAVNPGADAPVPGTGLGTPSTLGSTPGSPSADAPATDRGRTTSRDADTATSGAGSADRAGPGSTGMGR